MQTTWITVAVLATLAAVGVAVLIRTRWLQSRTMEKCVGLSVGLHLVLAVVAAFVGGWAPASWGYRDEGRMTMLVVLADETSDEQAVADATDSLTQDEEPRPERAGADAREPDADAAPLAVIPLAAAVSATPPADLVPLLDIAVAQPHVAAPPSEQSPEAAATAAAAAATAAAGRPLTGGVPAVYADRIGDRRAAAATARGGSRETELAVQAALEWLALNQSSDGLLNAARHGAGGSQSGGGQHRPEVGARSDHGVTGLALLAFLGAGTTHREGPHTATVARGVAALVERQQADGSLAGNAEFFAALYCHGMAAIALAECTAMTGDNELRPALDRAVRHTLAMQHPHTGGWRYAAGDRGDTSQLGWQVMVLMSSRNAGLGGFDAAEARARGFLQSVSSGTAGCLAAYRPGERPSLAMTAEALFAQLPLGMPADHPAAAEALGWLTRSPPTQSAYNIYTWYYATLASFHAGGPQWDAWNGRLQGALLPLQHRAGGPLDGSWDPDTAWGGHGGRVYATALAALTLEVYYRLVPLHDRAARMAAVP